MRGKAFTTRELETLRHLAENGVDNLTTYACFPKRSDRSIRKRLERLRDEEPQLFPAQIDGGDNEQ